MAESLEVKHRPFLPWSRMRIGCFRHLQDSWTSSQGKLLHLQKANLSSSAQLRWNYARMIFSRAHQAQATPSKDDLQQQCPLPRVAPSKDDRLQKCRATMFLSSSHPLLEPAAAPTSSMPTSSGGIGQSSQKRISSYVCQCAESFTVRWQPIVPLEGEMRLRHGPLGACVAIAHQELEPKCQTTLWRMMKFGTPPASSARRTSKGTQRILDGGI